MAGARSSVWPLRVGWWARVMARGTVNNEPAVISTVWVVRESVEYPLMQLFEDEASAWEFLRLHPDEGWDEPVEYEVVRYGPRNGE